MPEHARSNGTPRSMEGLEGLLRSAHGSVLPDQIPVMERSLSALDIAVARIGAVNHLETKAVDELREYALATAGKCVPRSLLGKSLVRGGAAEYDTYVRADYQTFQAVLIAAVAHQLNDMAGIQEQNARGSKFIPSRLRDIEQRIEEGVQAGINSRNTYTNRGPIALDKDKEFNRGTYRRSRNGTPENHG